MSYALVINDTIHAEQGFIPDSATLISDPGQWVTGLPWKSPEVWATCGWFEIVKNNRPNNTETTTWDRTLTVVNGFPTETWIERPKTQQELDLEQKQENRQDISSNPEQQVDDILAINDTINIILGSDTSAADTTTLRGMKKMSNANILTGPVLKDLIQHIINLAQEHKKSNRGVATLERLEYDVLDSTNVGAP